MEIYDVAIIPLIVGIVELFKRIGVPSKFCGLLSAFIGVLIGVFYLFPTNLAQGILVGLAMGLGASGLYSTTKNTIEGIKG
jgi:uncharacterized membrane protein HdeD (DUF308 family)